MVSLGILTERRVYFRPPDYLFVCKTRFFGLAYELVAGLTDPLSHHVCALFLCRTNWWTGKEV